MNSAVGNTDAFVYTIVVHGRYYARSDFEHYYTLYVKCVIICNSFELPRIIAAPMKPREIELLKFATKLSVR